MHSLSKNKKKALQASTAFEKPNVKRVRSEPTRYGYTATLSDLSITDDLLEEPYEDNSFDDEMFDPTKYIPTKRIPNLLKKAKKRKLDDEDLEILELNDEFDQITKSKSDTPSACTTKTVVHEHHDMSENSLVENTDSRSPIKKNALNSHLTENEGQMKVCTEEPAINMEMLLSLYRNSVEILARITVIEESMIKNKTLTTIKKEDQFDSINHANAFMKANNLPLNSTQHMKTFETNLECAEFMKVTVSDTLLMNTIVYSEFYNAHE